MQILVINGGSSSIKFALMQVDVKELSSSSKIGDLQDPISILSGELTGIGTEKPTFEVKPEAASKPELSQPVPDTVSALRLILDHVQARASAAIDAVGYRVVHPGPKLRDHQRITPEVLAQIQDATEFAPLHDPEAVALIQAGREGLPQAMHYACFDTVFHQTMPPAATTYALPPAVREKGVRRYGFHGLSCESLLRQLPAAPARVIIAHLGSGCSVTAVLNGQSIDTSMGLTPTGGVVMGTRPGDLDPGVLLYLLRQEKSDPITAVESMVNHGAGIAALSGQPNDMKLIRQAAEAGSPDATLALEVFTRSITKAIGSYAWLIGGIDAIVFTGGIGQHDHVTRAEVLAPCQALGIRLDPGKNLSASNGVRRISAEDSTVQILVVPAQEELIIALHVARMNGAENHPGT